MMYYKTAVAALLLHLFIPLQSQVATVIYDPNPLHASETKTITGVVKKFTDESALPLVEIYTESSGTLGFTNNTGQFSVVVPVNIASLNFRKKGYITAREVLLPNQRSDSLEIKLFRETPTEEEMKLITEQYRRSSFSDLSDEIVKEKESMLKSMQKTEVPSVIRVLMPDNTVVVMTTDEYLKGVVPSEVPPSWNMNALKAQAVAARCYASVNFKHNSQGADVCTSTHCQVWKTTQHSRTSQAVEETSNFSARYAGSIINALFFSHCNGTTRNNEAVWNGTPVPYLRSKSCICGFTSHNAHGVGMCQYGAQAMALKDSTWESILTWYYTGATIDKTERIYGTLKGVIYFGNDNTNLNNRITGAKVKIDNGLEVTSADAGAYSFDLSPGQYTVTASKPGYRSATVTWEVTAGNTVWGSIELVPNVGISELASLVKMYPNPARNLLNIAIPGEARVTIANIAGKVVYNAFLKSDKTIDVGNFERGTYIVRVMGKDYTTTNKIILLD